MLLTISTTHHPATDLGYLLHKNPARVQAVELAYGKAHVYYPEATAAKPWPISSPLPLAQHLHARILDAQIRHGRF